MAATESNSTMLVWGFRFFSGVPTCSIGEGWGMMDCILYFAVLRPPIPNVFHCPLYDQVLQTRVLLPDMLPIFICPSLSAGPLGMIDFTYIPPWRTLVLIPPCKTQIRIFIYSSCGKNQSNLHMNCKVTGSEITFFLKYWKKGKEDITPKHHLVVMYFHRQMSYLFSQENAMYFHVTV